MQQSFFKGIPTLTSIFFDQTLCQGRVRREPRLRDYRSRLNGQSYTLIRRNIIERPTIGLVFLLLRLATRLKADPVLTTIHHLVGQGAYRKICDGYAPLR